MNIVRKIHDQFRVKTVAGAQLETPEAVSSQGAGGSTFITITGGGGTSLNGSGLSEEDRVKLDSIEQGAQVNQDAFSKIQFDATSIDGNNQSSSSNSSIIANVPTDTANIKIVGNYPITVNLESVSLFNSNTSTTTGTAITTYNISFDSSNNIVIEYTDGTLLNVADVELIQVKHKEDVLATYQLSDITYTTSEGTITSFTIPYSNTDFSEIEFCKYETVTTETEEGSTTVKELRVLSTLPASPTKQSIITLNSLTDSFWNYEEDENGNKFVWTDYNVYSTKDVSAYGRGAGTGGSSASNLYELNDVVLTNLSNNDLLIYNSSTSKWVNINKDQLGISADQLHTLTISVNGVTQATYNPASADASVNISTITLNEVTEYIDQKIDTKLDVSEFFKWFTINYDSNNNVVSIQANFDFYSIGGVSAYGLGEGEAEPSYVSELGQLSDVTLTNVESNNILLYDGSKWVNKPMSSIVVDAYTKSEIDTKLSSISSETSAIKSNVANIQNSISGITSDISTINATISDIQTTLTGKLDKDDFFTWFTIIKNTSGEVVNIQANFDFYSVGEVSAYGLGDIGGNSRTTLATLDDVSLSNLITNDMLTYNGSKWVNIPMSQVRGATSWADLEDKPTTLSGYGITDVYTKTQVDSKISAVSNKLDDFLTGSDTDTIINKWKELESFLAGYTQTQTLAELLSVKANSSVTISAGAGLTGGGDLTANRTISLATSGVTAGTYTKVTVDVYGRVTSGNTLSASDIPNLDWSKITSGKPTTLEGYGITDGVNSIVLDGDGNAITGGSINNHILTLTKGATYLLQSTFDDMFEKVNIGTSSEPKYAIKAKYGFYSVGEIAAYGLNDDGKTTYTTLAELDDVLISNLAVDNLLKYDGTKWVNVPMSQMVVDAYTKSEMDNKLATLADIVEDVQRQTNRQVAFWFFEYDPTTTNYPASEWTTNEEKLKHEEDMFYNSTNGKVWRWKLNSSSQYEWSLITDADTLRALELVEIAQNTANQKKRNFITTPTRDDAYDVGDLWSNATYGTSYDNDLLVCITAKTAGTNFSISHWQPIGKVTSSYVSGQISIINNSINGLDTRVGTAETNISTAQSTANAAKTAAATAQSTADAAQSAANTAQSTADTAKTNAATAHTAANTAQSTADSAKSTANSALTKATTNESTLTTITSEAPSNLNTFKKLAAAINNDANYYNTVNNKITTEASTLNNKIDTKVSDLNSRIDTEVSTLNNKITSEVSTLNSKINAEVKKLQDQLDTIFSWFAFENDCIKAKYSLFSVGEITAHKTS